MPNDLIRRRTIGNVAAWEFGTPTAPLDVLFLHANGFNAGTYRQILAPLAADMRILAIDMRGHGATTLPTDPNNHAWRIYADDLLGVLAALGERPRVLAGHSMGGATALLAAPRLAAGPPVSLVLFDPVVASADIYAARAGTPGWQAPITQGALRRKPGFASRAEAMIAYHRRGAFKTWPDAMLSDYLEDGLTDQADGSVTLSCAPAWEAANFAAFASSNPLTGFPGITGPVHVLKAEHGSVCALASAAPPLTELRDARLETVPGSTHFLPMERPDLVQEALRMAAGHRRA